MLRYNPRRPDHRRHRIAAAIYRFSGQKINQQDVGRILGISQQAASWRISQFKKTLSPDDRVRFEYFRRGPRRKVAMMQLSIAQNV